MERGTARTATLPFMSFCTTANDGLPSKSAVVEPRRERIPSAAGHAGTGETGEQWMSSPNILMSPSVASRNWSVSTPLSWTGTSTNDWWAVCQAGVSQSKMQTRARQAARTLFTVSK